MRVTTSILLFAVLCCIGCKNKRASSGSSPKEPDLVERIHGKVKETVSAIEMHDLHLMMSNEEIVNNRLPTPEQVREYAKKENPKLSKLLEDGTIVLTGSKTRDSVWAYEKDAPTRGGWVVTGSGETKMTADELKKALGK